MVSWLRRMAIRLDVVLASTMDAGSSPVTFSGATCFVVSFVFVGRERVFNAPIEDDGLFFLPGVVWVPGVADTLFVRLVFSRVVSPAIF